MLIQLKKEIIVAKRKIVGYFQISELFREDTQKKVVYFLASSEYKELELEKSGGLDGARWFEMTEIPELRIYNDIIPLIAKAVEILTSKK